MRDMQTLKKTVIKLLRNTADSMDAGTSEASEEELLDILGVLCHKPMSKASACSYLNISRSLFDTHVREGVIPRGRKRTGFKELVWFKDELDECVRKIKEKK